MHASPSGLSSSFRLLSTRALLAGGAQAAPGGPAQSAAAGAAMAASPMAKYTAELQGIRAVLLQAKDDQLELEAKVKQVRCSPAGIAHWVNV